MLFRSRAHASTALIAKYFDTDNKMFGYLMEKEVKAVDKVLNVKMCSGKCREEEYREEKHRKEKYRKKEKHK